MELSPSDRFELERIKSELDDDAVSTSRLLEMLSDLGRMAERHPCRLPPPMMIRRDCREKTPDAAIESACRPAIAMRSILT
jgi:hypothetical protein